MRFMKRSMAAVLVCSVVVMMAQPVQAKGRTTLRGTVTLKGDASKYPRTEIDRSADPTCAKNVKKVETEEVVINTDTDPQTLRNVLVSIKIGLEDHAFAVPNQPVLLKQYGCVFKPHVVGLVEGQKLQLLNGDEKNHGIHFMSKVNDEFAMTQVSGELEKGTELMFVAEAPFPVICDDHPWMKAYLGVFKHPFFAVTGGTGMYEFAGMPPGRYVIEAWHEKFGSVSQQVDLVKGETTVLDFTIEAK